jgi:hypothetical protein
MAAVGGPPCMGSVLVSFMVALGKACVAGAPVKRPVGRGAPGAPGVAGTGRAGAWASGMVLLPMGAGGAGGPPIGRVDGGGGGPPTETVGGPAGRIGGGALRSGTVGAPGATARGADGGGADGMGMGAGATGTCAVGGGGLTTAKGSDGGALGRRVIRTVSFFKGTAEVFTVGALGVWLSGSLIR